MCNKEGLITFQEAQELCAKKYIWPHLTDKNTIATPLTEQELAWIKLQFPNVTQAAMPPHVLSPMVQEMLDPDGMGATPVHQEDAQEINHAI